METELKRVGSIVDHIKVFTLLAKEKVLSAVALDAGLTANICKCWSDISSLAFLTSHGSVLSPCPSLKL